jgi:hypothetical protein
VRHEPVAPFAQHGRRPNEGNRAGVKEIADIERGDRRRYGPPLCRRAGTTGASAA